MEQKNKRTKKEQTLHDRKIASTAKRLEKKGYKVKADIPGYEKPSKIGKKKLMPDIEASKRGIRKIIEVETKGSLKRDKAQQSTFRRHTAQKKRTVFEIVVAKERKTKKREIR